MEDLIGILVPIGICVVLPVMIVWLSMRKSMNETNKRTEIALEAIRNNSELNVEDFFKKMTPKEKLIKEKLMAKLQKACILLLLGIGFLVYAGIKAYVGGSHPDSVELPALAGVIMTAIGAPMLYVYFVSKKTLAKEMEAEEKALEQDALNANK